VQTRLSCAYLGAEELGEDLNPHELSHTGTARKEAPRARAVNLTRGAVMRHLECEPSGGRASGVFK
jgi:hypothetical protein